MGLIYNIEMGVLHGVVVGALSPFVQAGQTTAAKATAMADGVVNALGVFHAQQGHPQVDLATVAGEAIRGAVYAGLQPYVKAGDATEDEALSITNAVTYALGMYGAVMAKPQAA